jgi:hypothetical protein
MEQRDWGLLDKQFLGHQTQRNDGLTVSTVVAVFVAGLIVGGLLVPLESELMRIASNDARTNSGQAANGWLVWRPCLGSAAAAWCARRIRRLPHARSTDETRSSITVSVDELTGDPSKATIFGESADAISVAPLSRCRVPKVCFTTRSAKRKPHQTSWRIDLVQWV